MFYLYTVISIKADILAKALHLLTLDLRYNRNEGVRVMICFRVGISALAERLTLKG